MTFEEKEQCKGYYGFGIGYHVNTESRGYCEICPLKQTCWEAHRERCRQFFPDVCKLVDEKAKEIQGPELVKCIMKEIGLEPYMNTMAGNIEDGAWVKATGKPKDRGPYTIPYPFNVKN